MFSCARPESEEMIRKRRFDPFGDHAFRRAEPAAAPRSWWQGR
jgi:hypothetical protein